MLLFVIEELERTWKRTWPILKYFTGICLERMAKTAEESELVLGTLYFVK
jgi:hypothetical protein